MPSSLVSGPKYKFFSVLKKLTIKSTAVLNIEAREVPATGTLGDIVVDENGVLFIHNGTDFVAVGSQTAA